MKNNINTPDQIKRVYTVKEVAAILGVSDRHAYNYCNATKEFDVIKIGNSIRIKKDSFDKWFGS